MSDYLWDRSGEPDKEIQELEELLAPLGYQPRPLQIPAEVAPERRRRLYPALAIAATIAMAVLALALWLAVNHDSSVQPSQATRTPVQSPGPKAVIPPAPLPKEPEIVATPPKRPVNQSVHYFPARRAAKRGGNVYQAPQPGAESIAKRTDAEEGEAAKEQLLTALRIVSVKLNHAQQRTQGGNSGNQIRYQHKVG
ncbi:MAG: hypothetical protein QOE77_3519 [Blastocatellia bacterium]|jgi:hypothetical protein|nr:hypothetical protein [Blastocatellia bacterium]